MLEILLQSQKTLHVRAKIDVEVARGRLAKMHLRAVCGVRLYARHYTQPGVA